MGRMSTDGLDDGLCDGPHFNWWAVSQLVGLMSTGGLYLPWWTTLMGLMSTGGLYLHWWAIRPRPIAA